MRVGINLEKLADKYQGVAGVPDVAQVSVLAALDYKVTGLTTLDATLGLTKRTQGVLVDAKKAWTGSLAYRRQLTAKTSVNAQVTRAFNSYVFAGTSELDTTEAIGADWEVTRKIAVTIGYQHTKSDFLNDGTAVNANNPQDLALLGRLDKVDLGIVAINYSPLRWLTIQPHYNRLRRNSTQLQLSYNDTIIGIDVTVKRTYP